ncbi:hypothetical protein [Maribacter sp. 4G9]|uniref:hypothetical protein n=1 Tax=Maribacter sp. 4G9 TaxID=1889777 RepID=UPI000C15DADF|nr:hypothetical protein [Maribacter sp. 4G9]PIB39224.1 hypothetical protein BFP75_12665 [Maribacter sp. 4G9]
MNFRYIIGIVCCISATSCATFKSTATTGKLAQNLDGFHTLYNRPISICDFSQALDNTVINVSYCERYETNIQELSTALTVLSSYGNALERISKANGFSTDDQLDLIISKGENANWFAIGDESTSGIKKIISNTAELMANTVKRKNLREVVRNVNTPIQKLIDSLMLPELANRKRVYGYVIKQLNNMEDPDEMVRPDMRRVFHGQSRTISDSLFVQYNDLDNLTINVVEQFLTEDLENIDTYAIALEAFKESHQKLYQEYRRIGTGDDAEVAKEILELIKGIYGGTRQL